MLKKSYLNNSIKIIPILLENFKTNIMLVFSEPEVCSILKKKHFFGHFEELSNFILFLKIFLSSSQVHFSSKLCQKLFQENRKKAKTNFPKQTPAHCLQFKLRIGIFTGKKSSLITTVQKLEICPLRILANRYLRG